MSFITVLDKFATACRQCEAADATLKLTKSELLMANVRNKNIKVA
jgi:Fe-S cluster biogenesis protein NfuA